MKLLHDPTLLIIAINLTFIIGSYLWVFPCFIRDNISQLLMADTVFIVVAVTISGGLFWGKGLVFSLLGWSVSWFTFSLLSYFLLELPFSLVYGIKYFQDKQEH